MPTDGAAPKPKSNPGAPTIGAYSGTVFSARMAAFYGALFLIYGIHLPYFPVWLQSRGLTVEQISWVIAAPLFARIAITPLIASFADRAHSHRQLIHVLAALTLTAALILSQLVGFWPVAWGALILAIAFTGIMPLAESISLTGVRTISLDYGRMRLWGSASFIAASFIGGAMIEIYTAAIGIWLICAAAAVTLAAAWLIPKPDPTITVRDEIATPLKPDPRQHRDPTLAQPHPYRLLQSKLFILFLICAGLSQASHASYYAFATLQWLDQGISPLWVGLLWALGVIAEIMLFSFSRAVVSRTGAAHLMLAGALAGAIRWTVMAFDPPFAALLPLQVLHALTYGATHIGAVHFIAQVVPRKNTATAQAFYGAIGNGLAMGLAVLASGWLYATWGTATYLAMAAMSIVATIAGLMIMRHRSDPHEHPIPNT